MLSNEYNEIKKVIKAIGDYKQRPNMIGIYQTVRPDQVEAEMNQLLHWYHSSMSKF